jgi:hypothetical protein
MNVSGIRPYSGFYQYNSIRKNELLNQTAEAQPAEPSIDAPDTESLRIQQEKEIAESSAKQTFDSYDFAQQYRSGETFELKGADSDINSLDVEKAVSDLDKDQVLRQYQYFVKPKGNSAQQGVQQSVLRSAENFTL